MITITINRALFDWVKSKVNTTETRRKENTFESQWELKLNSIKLLKGRENARDQGLFNYLANTELHLPLTSQKQHFRPVAQEKSKNEE